MILALYVAFFLSGAAALIFENLWFRQVGLIFGNSVWASSMVLASFMAGLALGNAASGRWGHLARRPVLLYAAFEAVVAVAGLTLVYVLPGMPALLAPFLTEMMDAPALRDAVRLSAVFVMLVIPTTAMGMTLPILAEALRRRRPEFGRNLGALYGWNTLGAVVGAVAVEAVLLEVFGVTGSAWMAAAVAVGAALVASAVASRLGKDAGELGEEQRRLLARSGRLTRFVVAAALAGGIMLALEVVWFRFLALFAVDTQLNLAVILAVVLAGIGLGGLVASSWLRFAPGAERHARSIALLAGLGVVASYSGFDDWIRHVGPVGLRATALLAAVLAGPASFLSGVLFTLLGAALKREFGGTAASVGLLTLANTLGGMIGALVAGFYLLPHLGMEASFALLATAYGLVAACLPSLDGKASPERRLSWLAAGAWLLFVALFPHGLMERSYARLSVLELGEPGSRIVALREGLTETAAYLEKRVAGERLHLRLVTNGFSMSGTEFRARRYMRLYVQLPLAIHPGMKRSLLISYGVGNTADSLVKTRELESIDVVDISRDVLELSRLAQPGSSPLSDPRVRVHIEDGRHFLQTTRELYDLITGEPPPPKNSRIVSLYTEEFFQLARSRLEEGGLMSYWLPVHSLSVRGAQAIVRGFCNVFPDCSLWNGADLDWMLVGSRGATRRVSEERFVRQWSDPVVRADLIDEGVEGPEQLGALFIADAQGLRDFTGASAALVDDWPQRLDPAAPLRSTSYPEIAALGEAARRFRKSPLIAARWPAALLDTTVAAFRNQELLDAYGWGRSTLHGSERWRTDLHEVLTQTRLRTLVVVMLGSDPDRQRVAAQASARGVQDPWVASEMVIAAFARRDFPAAAEVAARAIALRPSSGRLRFQRAYALALAGHRVEARSEIAAWFENGSPTVTEEDESARRFLDRTFSP